MSTLSPKEPLLYLCHRIPYPPNKGDKIRSFNILKKLSENYDVHLGCFIDDPFDKQYVDGLAKYCASVFHLDQNKTVAKIKGLKSFLINKPITLPYYFDKRMQQWVYRVIAQHTIEKVFVYSSSMAQYCMKSRGSSMIDYSKMQRVIDFVDVDSDKWRQYADKKKGIAKWVFNREYRLLAKEEDKICQQFNQSLFVSPDEAELFRQRQPQQYQAKVHGILNGVDIAFFDPNANFSPEALVPQNPFITFTGAMDYWANIDAVIWFADYVWPLILKQQADAIFCIVGGNPSIEVSELAKRQGIMVTGRVHDVRPFIADSACVVAPLQIARGIQNKVLEAMSLDKPIVVTSMAMEGINATATSTIAIEDDAQAFADSCLIHLTCVGKTEPAKSEASKQIGNRAWVTEHFTWKNTLITLPSFFTPSNKTNGDISHNTQEENEKNENQ